MANQPNPEQLARSLVDLNRRECLWPMVFNGIKNIVRANNLNDDTRTCMKVWLKSSDGQLHLPMLSLTVLHTLTLNCSTAVRNQVAGPKLFPRLEKQLAKPQAPQVASAILQVFVDWAYLYGHEELGRCSRAVLTQPRYAQMCLGVVPSPAVVCMEEEMRLGLPPVAPLRGEDFVRWLYAGAGTDASFSAGGLRSGSATSGGGVAAVTTGLATMSVGAQQQQQQWGPTGGAPPAITPEASDAQRLTAALGTCRAAARAQRTGEVMAAMDGAYREAERCSQWRRRVQEFTQRCDDAGAMSAVLCATDTINQALARWQDFAGREVYEAMRITVPPMPPELLTQRAAEARSSNGSRSVNTAAAGAAANGRPAAAPPGGGKAFDIDDLLGMGSASTAGPAAAGTPAASGPHASAATSPAPWSQSNPFDPFDLGPPVAAATPAATPASGSATVAAGAALASMGSSGRPGASGSLPSTHVPTLQHPPHANPFQLAAGSAAVAAGQRPPPPQPATHTPAQTPASASTSYKVNPFDWDPFSEPLMAVQTALSSAAPIPATTASRGPLAAAGSNALPGAASGTSAAGLSSSTLHGTGSWAVFGEDMAHGSLGPVPPSPSGAAAAMSASAASFLPSPSASAASVVSTAAGGGGLPSPHSQPLHLHSGPLHGPATTPHYPTLSAGAALGSALPAGNSLQEATSNPKPPSLAQPPHAASGRQHGSALPSRQYSAPHGTTANGPNRAAAFPPSASSSDAGLDWRPGFEALSTDLRGLFAAQGGGTGGSALLPAVLSRVQALCESLAAQHVARVGTLQAAHVAEVRDVKGAALAKLREVMGAAGGHQGQSGPLQNQQQQQQQQQQQYQGVARANGGHVANGKGGGAAGAGDAISLI